MEGNRIDTTRRLPVEAWNEEVHLPTMHQREAYWIGFCQGTKRRTLFQSMIRNLAGASKDGSKPPETTVTTKKAL
jgi:hypothetical protein